MQIGCIFGEIFSSADNSCSACQPNSYSFGYQQQFCAECPVGYVCEGGHSAPIAKQGYYELDAARFEV